MSRTTISLDEKAQEIVEREDLNLSRWIRRKLKAEFDTIDAMEARLQELDAEDDRLLQEIQDRQKRRNELDKERRSLERALTRNKVIEEMKQDPEIRREMDQSIRKVRKWIKIEKRRETMEGCDYESVEAVVQEEVQELKDKVPASEDELEQAIRTASELEM